MSDPESSQQEHRLFRESVRSFVDREVVPNVAQWEADGNIPRDIFQRLGELGFLGLRFDPACGGAGLDYWYTLILCEELARCRYVGFPVSVLVQTEMATSSIDTHGSDQLKRRFLPDVVAGKSIFALGVTEPQTGSDVARLRTRAVRDGEHYVISGSKTFITNATIADYVTLAARTGDPGHDGISLIIVPTDTPGFQVGKPLAKMGNHCSGTAELSLDECRVPCENLIGSEGAGFQYVMQHFEGERLVLASFANALIRILIDLAVDYAQQRNVFGKNILEYQVWRHRLADLETQYQASKQLTHWACDALCRGKPANQPTAMAKLFSSTWVKKAADECLQIHGGYGYMEEYDICRLYRDVAAFTIGAGTSEIMREIIAKTARF